MEFVKESVIAAPVEAVFAFHERLDVLELLSPPWEKTTVVLPPTSLEVGTVVKMRSRVGLFWIDIEAEHVAYEKNVRFEDVMRKGPFRAWHHQHLFFEAEGGCRLRDEISYEPPLGWLGRLTAPIAIEPRLRRMFDYRHEVTAREVLNSRTRRAGR